MAKEVVLTERALNDLAELPEEVEETFLSKKDSTEKNLGIGAEPGQAFDKYLSGNMHPLLQMKLGRDYRAWFIEGEYIDSMRDDRIYCVKKHEEAGGQEAYRQDQERSRIRRTRCRIDSVSEMTSPSLACSRDSLNSSSSLSPSFTSSSSSTDFVTNTQYRDKLMSYTVPGSAGEWNR